MSYRLSAQELKKASTSPKDELGALRHGPFGRAFRYVFTKTTLVKRRVVGLRNVAPTLASHKGWLVGQSAAVNLSGAPVGVVFALISASQYGYVMASGPLGNLGGVSVYAGTDGGISAGDLLVKDETNAAGRFDTMTNTGTQSAWIMGKAAAADSGSIQAAGVIRNVFGDG